jgi:hypothetical protein
MTSPDQRESPWASGLTVVAATFLVIAGVWHIIAGFAAVVHDNVYVATPQYIYSFDLTAWGWIHILLGVLARVSKDLEASAVFPQVQLFSIFSLAYYPRQRCGAYWARSKVV